MHDYLANQRSTEENECGCSLLNMTVPSSHLALEKSTSGQTLAVAAMVNMTYPKNDPQGGFLPAVLISQCDDDSLEVEPCQDSADLTSRPLRFGAKGTFEV